MKNMGRGEGRTGGAERKGDERSGEMRELKGVQSYVTTEQV